MADLQRIQFKRSSVAGKKPTTSQLAVGELAINLTDRTLYTSTGTAIVDLGFGKGGQVDGDITATGTIKAAKLEGPLTGNADSATKLATARTIGGVSFDGTANINLPGVNIAGNQNTSGNAASATKLQTARLINNTPFDGTSNITLTEPVFSGYLSNYALSDYNNFGTNGFSVKYGSQTATNKPGGTDHAVITSSYSNIWSVQQAYDWRTNRQYNRTNNNGVWSGWRTVAYLDDNITGNAATATTLQTARSFSWSGDATGSLSFNGSANVSAALTLANTGVAAGTYKSVTVDTKGRVTAGTNVITGLVTSTAASGTTNAATSNTNTYLNIVETIGSAATTVGTSTQVTGAGTVTVTSDTSGKLTITGSQNITGNAATATKLQTARTISLAGSATGSISFDGTSNQTISVNVNAVDALAMYAKSNSDSPTKWAQGIQSVLVSSAQGWPLPYGGVITARPYGNGGGTLQILTAYGSDSGVGGGEIKIRTGDYSVSGNDGWTSWKTLVHSENVNDYSPTKTGSGASGTWGISVTGSAASLTTARTINGTSFNGTANITTANWGTARTLTIGNTGKSVNGSENVSWSLAEIGALPLTGGTTTGVISAPAFGVNNNSATSGAGISLYNGSVSGQPSYGLMFAGTSTFGRHGSVSSDWATYFTMTGDANRGWIFKHGTGTAGNVASISSAGVITASSFVGSLVGNASTASSAAQLTTARTIGGVSFNGTSNINLPGVNIAGNQSTTGNAATATRLQTARTINGVSFDGTANITIADSTKLPLAGGTMTGVLRVNNTTASTSATTGAITTTGGVGIGGALFTTGAITSANNITAYSDIRIKDNIVVIDDALNKVNQLNGITYNRNDTDDKDKRYVGLIAQEVQSVMPEAVNINNDEINTLSVDYQGLVGLLVEAIKELKTEIDELKENVK